MTTSEQHRPRIQRALLLLAVPLGLLALVAAPAAIGAVVLGAGIAGGVLDEDAVPATSLLPDLPADAEILGQEKRCGSGGCWWELRVDPGPGQSPAELAVTMGVAEERRMPGGLLSPRETYVGSRVVDDELRVYLGYEDLFP